MKLKSFIYFNENFIRYLVEYMPDQPWCYQNPYGDRESYILKNIWNMFVKMIKEEKRYFFHSKRNFSEDAYDDYNLSLIEILEYVCDYINKFQMVTSVECGELIYRGRIGEKRPTLEEFSPPPSRFAQQNRMSPAGITMFYGAFSKEAVVEEILNEKVSAVTIGQFKTLKEIQVVDFSKLPDFISLFDKEKSCDREALLFLKSFLEEFNLPIKKDGQEHIDYVPTQIFTEYIKEIFSKKNGLNIKGIIYPSSKINENCCVLFFNRSNCTHDDQNLAEDIYLSFNSVETLLAKPQMVFSPLQN